MSATHSQYDPLDDLTEEFARRLRDGERPTVEEYAERYPHYAEEIRAILPGVLLMEQLKPRRADVAPTDPVVPLPDKSPERVGEYRILREIGRGGMGVVYEAEQEGLNRRVALKVLPRHLLSNPKLRSRFRREAFAAARLHHTNIVPVFGVGASDADCYYVMQLIDGRGLDQVIRSQESGDRKQDLAIREVERAGAASLTPESCLLTPSSLTPFQIAQIGVQVADALAYAHARGILHRDIKPSNLLLDETGVVWVTDFGVAKLIEEAGLTESGEFVGTLKYMPPERFAGKSDARGDVYSLGVTLYELLTRRSAFPDTTPQHLIQLITHGTPVRPRRLNAEVPADLETIILKAAAPDPDHRYPTATEMADDLRRFLDDRPILARRIGLAERAWRWCRRNPALAAVTATAFLLLVAVSVVSLVAYAKTSAANLETAAANRDMQKALTEEKAQREHAEVASTLALDALNRLYDRFAPTRLVATPQALNEQGDELPLQPALPPEAVALMEDLLRTYEQLARAGGEFPKLQARAAEASQRIGDIRQRLGRYEDAATAYRAAVDWYIRLLPDPAAQAVRIKLARTYDELGRTLRALQQMDEADRMYEQAIRLLSEAPKELAERPEYRFELARASFLIGQRDPFTAPRGPGPPGKSGPKGPGAKREPPPGRGPRPDRDHPAQRAATLLEELVHEFPGVPEYRHLLACCYRDIPPERFGRDRLPAKSNADRSVELLRQLVADFPKVPDYRLDLCETLGRPGPPGRFGDAGDQQKRKRLEEAVSLSATLVAEYPNVPDYAAAHARYLDQLGISRFLAGQPDEAEEQLRKAVTLQRKLVKQYPDVIAYRFWLGLMERSLGRVLSERGAWAEAQTQLQAAVETLEALRQNDARLEPVRPMLGVAYRELARALVATGESALAAEARRKAGAFETEHFPDPFAPRGPR